MPSKHSTPLVSIGIPCFNHEKYIPFCLTSISKQTYKNYEVLFGDDASTDNSVEVANSFTGLKKRIIRASQNLGVSLNINCVIDNSSGEYITLVASDDGFYPEKLAKQVNFLNHNPDVGAVFTLPSIIGEDNKPLNRRVAGSFFAKKPVNRYAWLNHFFFKGNCLLAPSMMVRKKCFDTIGGFDSRYLQLQDFELYIRLCLAGWEIRVIDEALTYYRIRKKGGNLSFPSKKVVQRDYFENLLILREHFLLLEDPYLLHKIFPEIALGPIPLMQYELAMKAIESNNRTLKQFGTELLCELFRSKESRELIILEKKFLPRDLYALTCQHHDYTIGATLYSIARQVKRLF